MEGLADDVKCLVLDYISLAPDLAALCRVSKAWHRVTLPRLYVRVIINVSTKKDVLARMKHCLEKGAASHLKYTKSLIFTDDPRRTQVTLDNSGRGQAPSLSFRHEVVHCILSNLQDDKLRSFHYMSSFPLSQNCISHLLEHQRQIRDIYVDSRLPHLPIQLSPGNVHISFHKDRIARQDSSPTTDHRCLDSLTLTVSPCNDEIVPETEKTMISQAKTTGKFRAKRLDLEGSKGLDFLWLKLDHHQWSFTKIFDISCISHLALGGGGWDLIFLMAEQWIKLPALESLEISSSGKHGDFEDENLRGVFCEHPKIHDVRLRLEQACTHREWLFYVPHDERSLFLMPLCKNLQVPALCNEEYEIIMHGDDDLASRSLELEEIDCLCEDFPELRELGVPISEPKSLRIDELDVNPGNSVLAYPGTDHCMFGACLLAIVTAMKKLEVLHLYQACGRMVEEENWRSKSVLAEEIDAIADQVFREAHNRTQLKIFIWGTQFDYGPSHGFHFLDEEFKQGSTLSALGRKMKFEERPQFCYAKRVIVNERNEEEVSAVRMTMSRLREAFPEYKLLRHDPTHDQIQQCANRLF